MRVLVAGATGYIGGRLIPRLLGQGHTVQVLVRDPSRIGGRAWVSQVGVVRGDLLKPESLDGASWPPGPRARDSGRSEVLRNPET